MSEDLEYIDLENNKTEDKKKKNNKFIFYIILVLCVVVFVGCGIWIIKYFYNTNTANSEMEDIYKDYVDTEPVKEDELTVSENAIDILTTYSVPNLSIDFDALKEDENEDIYSWIYVPDTQINYPVLQHPTEMDYYLEYNIDGSKGYPGCIYSQYLNSKDYSDNNTVLYGHNMKNGSMFANLHYFEDPQFFEEHPYIYIYTPDNTLVYEIVAAYEYTNAHLLLTIAMDDYATFDSYVKGIYKYDGLSNNFRDTVDLTGDDKILTLSTCISGKSDKRFLVQGVLVADTLNGVYREDLDPIEYTIEEDSEE